MTIKDLKLSARTEPQSCVRRTFLVSAALFGSLLGCADPIGSNEEILTLDVAAARVPCQGAFPQECYRVRPQPDTDWTLFYGSIEGFDYQPGFEYTIKVVRRSVRNPPPDGSSFAYHLVSILRKVPA
jgi:hypothetical protein